MNKRKEMTNVVYSGWMTKSPPEKKLTGPWRIFRGKWKKCFFVLSKPAQSLPDIYHLTYYRNETCKRVRGSIDLEQCAEIIESLHSDQFPYLLAVKTTFKGKQRSYFLATETEEQMMSWVRNLCSVCGMKPDEPVNQQPTFPSRVVKDQVRPLAQLEASPNQPCISVMVKSPNIQSPDCLTANQVKPVSTKPVNDIHSTVPPVSFDSGLSEYIPLENCTSGLEKIERTISIDSVPDEFAPPPPLPDGYSDSIDTEGIYKVPPTRKLNEEALYKLLPTRTKFDKFSQETEHETYDIPPLRQSPNTAQTCSGESQKHIESAHFSQSMYVFPSVQMDYVCQDYTYDIPPSHDTPPCRPPKPGHLTCETYMNLPENSKTVQRKQLDPNSVVIGLKCVAQGGANNDVNDFYCYPKSTPVIDIHDKLLTNTPPPPVMCVQKQHDYINAKNPEHINGYLIMNQHMTGPDTSTRDFSGTDNEVEYTDMTRTVCDNANNSRALYDHLPQSCPVNPPPRPSKPLSTDKQDSCAVFSTERTRSFKKRYAGDSPRIQKRSPAKPLLPNSIVPLPQRVDRHSDYSTCDDNEEVRETSPPAPKSKDSELKYIDLDHDEATVKEPTRSPVAASPLSFTEYHDIDFNKTDALRKVREIVSVERSKEKNS